METTRVRQVVQHLRTGTIELLDLPVPRARLHEVVTQTRRSLLSAGTERMLLEFGRAGLLGKALQQPDRVRLVLDRLRTDGIAPTLEAAFTKLDEPLPLGYANVGIVREIGAGVHGLARGDRVVSNASHSSWARVGANLCALVPSAVTDDQATFAVPAAIGMQGIRLAEPTLGETFAVMGVGLIGLLTVQLLVANGCRVIAIDIRAERLTLAERFGARTVLAGPEARVGDAVRAQNGGHEVDGVIVCATTESDTPLKDAAQMTRKRGRIVLVGVAGLRLSRADFYAKELSFQVSCSYGPGRYDPAYELGGQDYPLPFVRWTEQRNFQAVLELMAAGRLEVARLISHRFDIEAVEGAYEALLHDGNALGILLSYGEVPETAPAAGHSIELRSVAATSVAGDPAVVVIGAGSYARRFLIPALRDSGASLRALVASGSALAGWAGKKFGFQQLSTDAAEAIALPGVEAVVVATRHDSHADYVCQSLLAGKHVFVEKPLALSEAQLGDVEVAYAAACQQGRAPVLMVGFNRRFAPLAVEMKRRVEQVSTPKSIIYTVNAGAIAPEHWTQDLAVGGGRIVGEACHFIDFIRFLVGAPITGLHALSLPAAVPGDARDSASISLRFADGSVGTVHYFANGARTFPKERIEVFAGAAVLRLDNFRSLTPFSWPGARRRRSWARNKGNRECVLAFTQALRSGTGSPIPPAEIFEVSRATLEAARQAQEPEAAGHRSDG